MLARLKQKQWIRIGIIRIARNRIEPGIRRGSGSLRNLIGKDVRNRANYNASRSIRKLYDFR